MIIIFENWVCKCIFGNGIYFKEIIRDYFILKVVVLKMFIIVLCIVVKIWKC